MTWSSPNVSKKSISCSRVESTYCPRPVASRYRRPNSRIASHWAVSSFGAGRSIVTSGPDLAWPSVRIVLTAYPGAEIAIAGNLVDHDFVTVKGKHAITGRPLNVRFEPAKADWSTGHADADSFRDFYATYRVE